MAASVTEMRGYEQPQEDDREYRYSDAELVSAIDFEIQNSVTGEDSVYATACDEAERHYRGSAPEPLGTNTSDYVSMEVFESVESMKAKLYKTFCGSRDVVRFIPMSEDDVEGARLRTAYVKRLAFGENRGAKVFHDFFHNVCLKRVGILHRYPKKLRKSVWKDFQNVPAEQVQAAAMQESVEDIEITSEQWQEQSVPTQFGPVSTRKQMLSGRMRVVEETTKLCIESIEPGNVRVPNGVTDLTDLDTLPALVLIHYKRRGELIAEGFEAELVDTLDDTASASTLNRGNDIVEGSVGNLRSLDMIEVEEAYMRIDMETPKSEPEGLPQLWQVIKSGSTILSKQPVDEIPVRFGLAYHVAGDATGISVADVSIDVQRAVSNTTRGIIDNVHRVNAGLRMANMDAIKNPRDLIDNPIGGIIDTDNPQAVSVVPQPAISAGTLPLLEVLAVQKEMRTGDMRMGRGLNTQDIVTHQNAKDMISNLIEVGNARPMMLASLIAETCIKPLLLDLWRIGVEEDISVPLEVEGKLQMVSPKQIPPGDEMSVDFALTPEYGQKRAQDTLMLHQLLMANPVLSPLYQMQEQYAAVSEVCDLLGQPNWLANPTDQQVGQRLQMAQQAGQQQQQMQQQAMMLQFQQAQQLQQAQLAKIMAEIQKLQSDPQLKKEDLNLKAAQGAAKQSLDEREFEHQRQVDKAEIEIERDQARQTRIGSD